MFSDILKTRQDQVLNLSWIVGLSDDFLLDLNSTKHIDAGSILEKKALKSDDI